MPTEWQGSLHIDASLDLPPPRPVEYIYPRTVKTVEMQKCLDQAYTLSWQDQIRDLVQNRLTREPTTNMIAFTISDYNYAVDMLHEIFEMNDNIN